MNEETTVKKKELVHFFMQQNILVDEQLLQRLDTPEKVHALHKCIITEKQTDSLFMLQQGTQQKEEEKNDVKTKTERQPCKIVFSYKDVQKKREIKDFVLYFNNRYKTIRSLLQQRQELQGAVSINRLLAKKEKEQVALIGILLEKQVTKNGNYILVLEDITGTMKVLLSKNKPELITLAKDILEDEVIGIVGTCGDKIIFANSLLYPDIPLNKEFKKAPEVSYALFTSDLHIGAKMFLHENWTKFIKWLNGEIGSDEQKKIVEHIHYLFFVGDLIDGVGIYPDQEKDLAISDVYAQYDAFAAEVRKIPSHINIIICPGNHDAMRVAEPQPVLYKEYARALYDQENVLLVTNPALVNIGAKKNFPGFDVLLYHGFSIPYIAEAVESIRQQGGMKRVDLIMKYMLQRRHLAPSHESTQYIPDPQMDPLVIEKVPDFFVTGHVHRTSAGMYRNVTMLNCSTWMAETDYQRKVGLVPEPGRVHVVNLQTREVKIMKF